MGYAEQLAEASAAAQSGRWEEARASFLAALDETETAEVLDGLAHCCWWLGEVRDGIEYAQRAFDRYVDGQRYDAAAMVALHLCVWFLTNLDNDAAARGWLARAAHLSDRLDDPVVRGWVDLFGGYLTEDSERSRQQIERASAAASEAGDADLATMALADLGLWHVLGGDAATGLAMLDEAMAATLSARDTRLEVVVWSSCNMLAACSRLDDLRRATQWVRVAEQFMQTYGCPFLQARCRAHYGRVLVAAGRWGQAESELEAALAMAADTGAGPRTEALAALAELRLLQGHPDEASALLADASPLGAAVLVDAAARLATGRPAEAASLLRGVLALNREPDPAAVSLLVETLLAVGDLDGAAALVGPGAPVWSGAHLPRATGRLSRAAGLVAAAQGDQEGARAHFGLALELFSRLELPYEVARTELDAAQGLAPSDPQAAAVRAGYALRAFQKLGATTEASRTAALLRELGVTPGPGPREHGRLTRREDEILALVGQGLSNPEIAARLFLSRRTVGHHVSSILRKLGLRSRTEAAALAVREGRTRS